MAGKEKVVGGDWRMLEGHGQWEEEEGGSEGGVSWGDKGMDLQEQIRQEAMVDGHAQNEERRGKKPSQHGRIMLSFHDAFLC